MVDMKSFFKYLALLGETGDSYNIFTFQAIASKLLYY